MEATSTPPISFTRLKQIANDACQNALGSVDLYEHARTESWNTNIINSILRALISESSPANGSPSFKYAVNSTIIQHLVPTSTLHKAKPAQLEDNDATISTSDVKSDVETKSHVGRRGMHSASGAYWNQSTDGMWSFKYEGGESKGLDVVISVLWIAI